MTKIIGITGLAGSGKDTLAEFLTELDRNFAVDSFAGPIRRIAAALGLCIYDREAKELPQRILYEHFEVSLIDAVVAELGDKLGEETLCDLYATFVTILRSRDFLTTERQDVLQISPRVFCQLLGTDAGRAIRQSLWVDVLRATARRTTADFLLVPDVRFKNEALVCDYVIGVSRPGVAPVAGHDSEKEIPALVLGADYGVVNNGTLEQLRHEAGVLHRLIRGGVL